jgi:hypothetical protein
VVKDRQRRKGKIKGGRVCRNEKMVKEKEPSKLTKMRCRTNVASIKETRDAQNILT